MVKRVFKSHRLAIILVIINSVIVFEEFAHQHWYLPAPLSPGGPIPMGLGWYWTAVLSFPSSLILYSVHWSWSHEFLSLLMLLLVGAFQWGVIGTLSDRSRRGHSTAKT
jgi:hypothetical protein